MNPVPEPTHAAVQNNDPGHTNLTDWTSIFTNHAPAPPFVWTDSGVSNFNRRFYRILLGP
jgi:hypothetical protein